MSGSFHFPLFSSIARRIGKKLGSTKRYMVEFLTIDDFTTDLDRKPDNVHHFYVRLQYYLPGESSRYTQEIQKKFKTRREVNDFVASYNTRVHIKKIIRGVVLK